jgi:hypothetical protein
MSTINWADLVQQAGESASNTNYEPLPDGDYELKVIQAQATTTSTGKVMFKVTNEVQGGPFAKRRVWDQLVVTTDNPKAMNMFFMKASAMGLGRTFWDANPSNAQVEQALNGRTFRATLGKRTYNGTESNEIKRYFASQVAPEGVGASATPFANASPVPPPPPPAPSSPITASEPF